MFKILPLIVSLGLVGAGGAAVVAPNYVHNESGANAQTSANATVQSNTDSNVQDSSDLFLSARGNSSLDIDLK